MKFAFIFFFWGVVAAPGAPLTRVIDLSSIPMEQARQGLPVTLRGTVIFVAPELAFVEDGTAGTYFRSEKIGLLQPGDEIEVTGRTEPGLYLPGLNGASFRLLRHGPLPPARSVTYEDLLSGRYHYQRVALEGIVRSVTALSESRSLLRLGLGSRVIEVWVEDSLEKSRLPVDGLVRTTGVAVGTINGRRQIVQPYVRATGWAAIAVVRPPPPASAAPRIDAADLPLRGMAGLGGKRFRIGGTVTAAFPRGMIYLRNPGGAFGVRLSTAAAVQIGDRIEVLGFAETARSSASVVDAQIVSQLPGTPPPSVPLHLEDLFRGSYNGELVTITGVITDSFRNQRDRTLVLQENERRVQVVSPEAASFDVPVGSRLRATGILRVDPSADVGYLAQPESIMLIPRSPADLTVVRRPSWWTVQRLSLFLAVLATVMLFAVLWIVLLRRQVRRQAETSRCRIESEAALQERHRLARDFHDTLEQELVGLGLRLDAVATRELDVKGRSLVETSRSLVARIQAETRNLVSGLRSPAGSKAELASVLDDMAELKAGEGGPEVRAELGSELPLLPIGIVHNLRMIARESVTNARKHSSAKRVVVRLEMAAESKIAMSISDDGCGFDAVGETRGKKGHFGCVGIRERCVKIGAEVEWRSAPGQGTTVQIRLPLARA